MGGKVESSKNDTTSRELIKAMPKATGAKGIGPIAIPKWNSNATLASQGISLKQSMVWQKVAAIPVLKFEAALTGTFPSDVGPLQKPSVENQEENNHMGGHVNKPARKTDR